MARTTAARTDKRLGLSIVLGIIAGAGGIAMLAAPGGIVAAAGFGVIVLVGLIWVVLLHTSV